MPDRMMAAPPCRLAHALRTPFSNKHKKTKNTLIPRPTKLHTLTNEALKKRSWCSEGGPLCPFPHSLNLWGGARQFIGDLGHLMRNPFVGIYSDPC
jgi:hypothetical protein